VKRNRYIETDEKTRKKDSRRLEKAAKRRPVQKTPRARI
jgi:hypothetical protein